MPPTGSPRRCSRLRPLTGRRLHFVGIGGAGLSGYALLAHAWGADVSGWDRYETPYLAHLPPEIDVTISAEPEYPGWRRDHRLDRVQRPRRGAVARRVPRRAGLAPGLDRRRGRARKDDDRGDDRVRPRAPRPRSRVPDRRRGAAAGRRMPERARAGSSSRATSRTGRSSCFVPGSRSSRTSTSTTTRSSRRAPR